MKVVVAIGKIIGLVCDCVEEEKCGNRKKIVKTARFIMEVIAKV